MQWSRKFNGVDCTCHLRIGLCDVCLLYNSVGVRGAFLMLRLSNAALFRTVVNRVGCNEITCNVVTVIILLLSVTSKGTTTPKSPGSGFSDSCNAFQ